MLKLLIKKIDNPDNPDNLDKSIKGSLFAVGNNGFGQLGLGDNKNRQIFTQVGTDTDYTDIFNSNTNSSYVMKNNLLHSCGNNVYGILGLGDTISRNVFTPVIHSETEFVKAVSLHHNIDGTAGLFLGKNGHIYGVGKNEDHELSIVAGLPSTTLVKINENKYKDIFMTDQSSIIIAEDDSIYGSGFASNGQFNLGYAVYGIIHNYINVPVPCKYKKIFVGNENVCFLSENDDLYGCGVYHALGLTTGGTIWFYDVVYDAKKIFSNVKHISLSNRYSFLITNDHKMFSAGENYKGNLGLGHYNHTYEFTQVGTDNDWVDVCCSNSRFVHAIKQDGTLWACGDNSLGQLGLGDYDNRNVFTQVGTDTDWKKVVCGLCHALAIKG